MGGGSKLARTAGGARIIESLHRHLERRPEIVCAYLHGSFLEGGAHRDIDVAVWLDPHRGETKAASRYAVDLSAALTVALGCLVDVQVLNIAPLAFRYQALKGRPILVRDREWLDDLRARTWDEYFDFLPFARQYLRDALGA